MFITEVNTWQPETDHTPDVLGSASYDLGTARS